MNARTLHSASRRSDEGVALLLALLFIVLLTVLVVEFAYENQVESSFVDVRSAQFEAEVAAQSAVASGMGLLAADATLASYAQQYQSGATGSQSMGGSQASNDQLGALSDCDSLFDAWAIGVPYRQINKAVMQCKISDEFGKININALLMSADMYGGPTPGAESRWGGDPNTPQSSTMGSTPINGGSETTEPEIENTILIEALRSLFVARGAQQDPTDAILDWIDRDDDQRANGAENDFYGTLEVPYATKNGPLDSVEELLLIKGITPEIFFGNPDNGELPLTELLTCHGDPQGRININTAPPEVLAAMGEALGQPGMADRVIEERELNPITNEQDAQSRGLVDPAAQQQQNNRPPSSTQDPNQRVGPDGQPIGEMTTLDQQPFVFSSRVFRIRGNGESGEVAVRIEAYVERDASMGMMNTSDPISGSSFKPVGENPQKPGGTGGTGSGTGQDNTVLNSAPSMFRILDWRIER